MQWEDTLAVFSAWIAGSDTGTPISTLTDAQLGDLRTLMWEMNEVDYDTHTETHTEKVTEIDEEGNKKTYTETVRETILTIEIKHKSPTEMVQKYSFSGQQKEYLALLTAPDTAPLWAQLLGPYSTGAGIVISPDTTWEGTGIFQWPLPESFTITSYFGSRNAGTRRRSCDSRNGERHGSLGRRVWILHKNPPQRFSRNALCALFRNLRICWAAGKTRRGDRLRRHDRQFHREPPSL